jgi:hypothetical protein
MAICSQHVLRRAAWQWPASPSASIRGGLHRAGRATFTVGEETIDVTGGQIVVAPAGVPHKFINPGTGPLRQIDIHANDRFVTVWLEE